VSVWTIPGSAPSSFIAASAIAYLDRVNIGFANATMSKDLGLTAAEFSGATGIFFIGYFFFEVPSNLLLPQVWPTAGLRGRAERSRRHP
jgi:hypothetical protein